MKKSHPQIFLHFTPSLFVSITDFSKNWFPLPLPPYSVILNISSPPSGKKGGVLCCLKVISALRFYINTFFRYLQWKTCCHTRFPHDSSIYTKFNKNSVILWRLKHCDCFWVFRSTLIFYDSYSKTTHLNVRRLARFGIMCTI